MTQKSLNILFITFFAWNALFGAADGLMICFHDDSQVHADLGQKHDGSCETDHAASDSSNPHVEAKENCVDFEIYASLDTLIRPEHLDVEQLFDPFLLLHKTTFNSRLTLRELAPGLQAQAPPALIALSVQTVQLTQLRI